MRVPTASTWSHDDTAAARAALSRLYELQECVIRGISWSEPAMELVVVLDYIWLDDGRTCFSAGAQPRTVTTSFRGVDLLELSNALTAPMLSALGTLSWGVSEIAALEIEDPAPDRPEFATARFVWERPRYIKVMYREMSLELSEGMAPPS